MSDASVNQPVPEPGVEPDGIDTISLFLWGFVSVIVTLALMFASAALYFQAKGKFTAERVMASEYLESNEVLNVQRGVLTSYGPPAAEGKPYKIPVEEAKQLVLAELNAE